MLTRKSAYGSCAGNVTDTLSSAFGNPAAQIYFNAAGQKGGLALWFWAILVQFFTGITAMLADTRTCFVLARRGASFLGTLPSNEPPHTNPAAQRLARRHLLLPAQPHRAGQRRDY